MAFKISRVGSGLVGSGSVQNLAGRLGSGREVFKSRGSGQVRSRVLNLTGRVGSGQEMRKSSHGLGQVMTREKRVTRGSGQHDPRVVSTDPQVGPRIRLANPTLESLPALLPKRFSRTNTQ